MVGKVNVWIFVTVLLVIGANGFSLSDLYSSDELDNFDSDIDSDIDSEIDSSIDEADYLWSVLFSGSPLFRSNERVGTSEEKKWNEIDDVDLNDDAEGELTVKCNEIDILHLNDETETEIVEMIRLQLFSESQQTTKKYNIGRRVRGDNVVAFSATNHTWPQGQNVTTNLTYPATGVVGRRLTYIEIQVNQTSNLGHAYVKRGGVGQRFITVVVEATKTLYFNFKATFYGL